jgi:hypothetical protein
VRHARGKVGAEARKLMLSLNIADMIVVRMPVR